MEVGAVLRAAREQAGLSQAAVAERVGVTRFALSRWESGSRPVRSDDADSVLAACGRDIRWVLVPRHEDSDAEIYRLGSMPLERRLGEIEGLVAARYLTELQATGGVTFGGAWAAAVLGLPRLTEVGHMLCDADPEALAAIAAVLARCHPLRIAPGGPFGVTWNADVLNRYPEAEWDSYLIGRFTTQRRPAGAVAPELRVASDRGAWRTVPVEALVPAVVDAEVLARWRLVRPAAT